MDSSDAESCGSPEGLSMEEFTRLQDELMALRLYHEELLGERRWLERAPPAPAAPWAAAAAATASLSSQVKVGTEALSSLGNRGMATFAKRTDNSELELKTRIRALQEEAEEFRSVAANARSAAAAVAAAPSSEAAGVEASDELHDSDDEDTVLLKQKIKAQKSELDRLTEIFQRQQEQMLKLQDQISGKEEERQKLLRREVQAKLKDRETQVEGMLRQLRSAEEESRQSQDLRNQLRDFAEQAINRNNVLAEMRSVFHQQAANDALEQERLFMVLEDLAARADADVSESRLSGRAEGAAHPPGAPVARTPQRPDAGAVTAAEQATVEAQCDLDPSNSLAAVHSRLLLQQIDDLRIEKGLLEKRSTRELQDLEALVKPRPKPRSKPKEKVSLPDWPGEEDPLPAVPVAVQSEWFAAQQVEFHNIGSDDEPLDWERNLSPESVHGQEEYPVGLHYVQQVAELEAKSDELKLRLEELHEAESALRRESQEKNDLIALLLRKTKLPEKEKEGWWSRGSRNEELELQRVIEETTEDNIRLRNDIKIMSDQLRKVLAGEEAPPKSR
ncbi:unnamed protein product, partial [Effrenium voratum]